MSCCAELRQLVHSIAVRRQPLCGSPLQSAALPFSRTAAALELSLQ